MGIFEGMAWLWAVATGAGVVISAFGWIMTRVAKTEDED